MANVVVNSGATGKKRVAGDANRTALMAMWKRNRRQPSWLRGLLGPGRPEMSCDECFATLDRYVDLEAAGADAEARYPGMEAHLEGCRACREEHDVLLQFVKEASV